MTRNFLFFKSGGNMNPMLNIAIRAARRSNIIAKNYERRDAIESTKVLL